MTYQKKTGTLSQGAHPGSYNGQDAYNDMLVTVPERERESMVHRERSDTSTLLTEESGCAEHDERYSESIDTEEEYVARRLTPTECARLQGFPDDWCSDVPHSDSAEYKLWGNGIALPTILPMMKSMADILRKGGD